MWRLEVFQRGESAQTEGINVVVAAAVEDVTPRACEREDVLRLLTLVQWTILSFSQVINE